MTVSLSHIAHTLEKELEWFSSVIDHAFNNYFQKENNENQKHLPIPDLTETNTPYARLITQFNLGSKERLAIMLSLCPHIKPQALDIFFTKNSILDRPFTEFGGIQGKSHTGFLPTGETLQFILCQGVLEKRFVIENMLQGDQVLFKNDILYLETVDNHEPMLSGKLNITAEFKTYLTSGKWGQSHANKAFPAKQITTSMDWDDLIISSEIREEIEDIKRWIEQEHILMQNKTFRKHVKPGYRALFYGPPGTGKTLTASLLGKATGLDVYRVDLSLIVSKYIGETEKNLSQVFDMAEKRNWILFFDEADSLFGKRTKTNSSNDRYANQEVSYLLQRIEDFPGTIILASNLKSNMDDAFSRRFQSMIYFPMPTAEQRLTLWKQFFSERLLPQDENKLANIADKYELSGGSAINVYRYSVLKASERKAKQVCIEDIMQGLKKEYQKYGKTI